MKHHYNTAVPAVDGDEWQPIKTAPLGRIVGWISHPAQRWQKPHAAVIHRDHSAAMKEISHAVSRWDLHTGVVVTPWVFDDKTWAGEVSHWRPFRNDRPEVGGPVVAIGQQGAVTPDDPGSTTARIHCVKSWPKLFEAAISGEKTHELRKFDRPYLVGDILRLEEYKPESRSYTGRLALFDITAITSAEHPCALSDQGLAAGFCILSIRKKYVEAAKPTMALVVLPAAQEIAKALVGPKHPIPVGSTHSLAELREIAWTHLTTGPEQLAALASAEAILQLFNKP